MEMLVCGSRGRGDESDILTLTELIRFFEPEVVIEGCARGADRAAEIAAEAENVRVRHCPAQWERFGRRAGYLRNEEMLAYNPDICIALWDGESKGTKNMMDLCRAKGIEVLVI
jgi:YspA, cpYpsA-related SLOG family